MRAVDIIGKKRDGHPLTPEEIEAYIQAATYGQWPDYHLSALLMAILLRGVNATATATLTGAMVRSGVRLDLPRPKNRPTQHRRRRRLMSGRGLGHNGGTLSYRRRAAD